MCTKPPHPRRELQKQIAGDLLRRVFGGSAMSLVMGALQAQPASAEELADIRKMIKKYRKDQRGSR